MGARGTEEFTLGAPRAGTTPPHRPTGRARAWPVLPWVACALALIVAAVAVAPAPPPGVSPWGYLPHLRERPELAWQLESTEVTGAWAFGGVLAVADLSGVAGMDARSGRERWRLDARAPRCTSDGTLLTCLTRREDAVLVVDPDSGATNRWDVPDAVAAIAYEDGVVAVTTSGLTRIDADGRALWTQPRTLGAPVAEGPAVIDGWLFVSVLGPVGGLVPLDVETGEPGDLEVVGRSVSRVREGLWTSSADGTIRLFARDQQQHQVGDPRDYVATVSDPALLAEPLPRTQSQWSPLALLPGVALGSVDGTRVAALDTSTGHELWRRELVMGWIETPLVDEETMVTTVLDPATGSRSTVQAIDARTGADRWRLERPGHIRTMIGGNRHLYLLDAFGVTAWELSR
ncbi:PQQ-like beta-propeller repeat protein [Ruania suaedae]|uniref:outer membrane protein assembly factor BamB family protein n=1 Tax=Ruania suaedae TaxID=2897774 RepID=UPI001E5DCEEB|nr:PQQ-binding-like beta-propeller repeat protein [Ruania suaedae]UFU02540.1 PQQ-like beta-propeller repeat protein [Ruania suaedae]